MTKREPSSTRRKWARVMVGINLVIACILVAGWMPGPVGTAVSIILPLLGIVALVVLLVTVLLVPRAGIAASVAVLLFLLVAAPAMPALPRSAGEDALTIASQNVRAQSGNGEASARALMEQSPDIVTLTELDWESREEADAVLSEQYEYSYAVGTVGIWSVYPLFDSEALDLGLGWNRALRVIVEAPAGDTSVYLIHAASLRPGTQSARDEMLAELAATVREDESPRIIALGDFNAATTDPALRGLASELDRARPTDGLMGFTWPAKFPLARIDHLFQRGFEVASSETLRAGSSDHLAILVVLSSR